MSEESSSDRDMKKYYVNDSDRVRSLGTPSEEYCLSEIPRPYTLYRDWAMRRWVDVCPNKPKDNPILGLIWKDLPNIT